MMGLFKKYKVKAKKLYTIIMLSILEIILILWSNEWAFHIAIVPVFIQLAFIFENKDIWSRLTEKEKKEIMLAEEDIKKLIEGITKLLDEGKNSSEILDEIKKEN